MTPLTTTGYALTKLLTAVSFAALALVAVFVAGLLTGAEADGAWRWVVTAALILGIGLMFGLYGLGVGLFFGSDSAAALASISMTFFAFFGNVFMPLDGVMLDIARFTALYGFVALSRWPLTEGVLTTGQTDELWMLLLNVAGLARRLRGAGDDGRAALTVTAVSAPGATVGWTDDDAGGPGGGRPIRDGQGPLGTVRLADGRRLARVPDLPGPRAARLRRSAGVGRHGMGGALVAFIVLYVTGFMHGMRGGGGLGRTPLAATVVHVRRAHRLRADHDPGGGRVGAELPAVHHVVRLVRTDPCLALDHDHRRARGGGRLRLPHPRQPLLPVRPRDRRPPRRREHGLDLAHRALGGGGAAGRELATSEGREAVARDVHDLIGHSLTVVGLKAQLVRRLMDSDRSAPRPSSPTSNV
ncbi:histidine kinase [Microbacterium sp. NRRL B-14842]|uniref:histidine kinase n=1 Tax=Microbacterium sp. NRRL B-14842 TaxID=3162881 RepID=UPI003D26B85F